MATELIAVGTTAADSADVTVAAGSPVTIFMKKASGDGSPPVQGVCEIKQKTVGGAYQKCGELTGAQVSVVIDAPGTYRISRMPCVDSFGVDQG